LVAFNAWIRIGLSGRSAGLSEIQWSASPNATPGQSGLECPTLKPYTDCTELAGGHSMPITYADQSWKCTIQGSAWTGLEVWSTSFFMGGGGFGVTAPTQAAGDAIATAGQRFFMGGGGFGVTAPTQAAVDAIATAWQTFFTATGSLVSNLFKTDVVKLAIIDEDGTPCRGAPVYPYYTPRISGASAASAWPPQCPLAATLTTAKPRGFGSKGRMYLPGMTTSIDSSGKIPSTNQANIANPFQTFMNTVIGHTDIPYPVIVNSREVAGIPGHAAAFFPVTGNKIGNVIDTQRRRRNGLVETYESRAVA